MCARDSGTAVTAVTGCTNEMRLAARRSYTTTANMNWLASIGAGLGVMIGLQLVTGVCLHLRYSSGDDVFQSLASMSRDLDAGFSLRALHSSGATVLMLCVYAHMSIGLWYGVSDTQRMMWLTGVVLYIVSIGVSFTGYSLTGGQMSHWAITVICSLVSAVPVVGPEILTLLWGGGVVSSVSVLRLLTAHMLLPIVMAGIAVVHLAVLHQGNSVWRVNSPGSDRVGFTAMYVGRDAGVCVLLLGVVGGVACMFVEYTVDLENSIRADSSVTPASIAPEWYLLPFYGLVRALPDKMLGVVMMGLSYGCLISVGDAGLGSSLRSPVSAAVGRSGLCLLFCDCVLVSCVCLEVNTSETGYWLLVAGVLGWMSAGMSSGGYRASGSAPTASPLPAHGRSSSYRELFGLGVAARVASGSSTVAFDAFDAQPFWCTPSRGTGYGCPISTHGQQFGIKDVQIVKYDAQPFQWYDDQGT